MHALSYLQKRGHLSAVALGRKMFRNVQGMTPARFDLLHVIFLNGRKLPDGDKRAQMLQASVRRRLGLARQTVWNMVKRLVELGFLERGRHPDVPRQVTLQLTADGLRRMRQAYGVAFTDRHPVPKRAGGRNAPRHVYSLVRRQAERDNRQVKSILNTPIPFMSRQEKEAQWGHWRAPPKIGRDVAKIFTSFAWKRAGTPTRGRRLRMLGVLENMVRDARTIARALGDESDLIYPAPVNTPEPETPPERTTVDFVTWLLRPDLYPPLRPKR